MTTTFFLLDVVAFVLVAVWAYRNAQTGDADSGAGLFGMRSGTTEPGGSRGKPAPRWRTAGAAPSRGGKSLPTR